MAYYDLKNLAAKSLALSLLPVGEPGSYLPNDRFFVSYRIESQPQNN